jgi:cytochrome c biogenesis protein CcmG/thiol:disulfide interchange protein DsbE
MRASLNVLGLLGCGLLGRGLLGCGSPAPVIPVSSDPGVLYQQAVARYQGLKTYADHGDVTVELITGGQAEKEHYTFTTAFVRGGSGGTRFTLRAPGKRAAEYELWTGADHHTYVAVAELDHILDYAGATAKALGEAEGVTDGVTTQALAYLMGVQDVPTALVLAHTTDTAWTITGKDRDGDPIQLTIDRKTGLFVQVVRGRHFEATVARPIAIELAITMQFAPAPDATIAAAALEPLKITLPIEPDGPPAWIGVMTEDSPPRVSRVVQDAPADKAGIKVGDEVVSIDGHPTLTSKDVVANAHKLRARQQAPIVVTRGGTTVPLVVIAEARPVAATLQTTMIGKHAPAFSLPVLGGGPPAELTSQLGHVVVVEFWATWCKPCAITTPHIDGLFTKLGSQGLRVIGISDESPGDVSAFLANHKVSYALALDPQNAASAAYLIQGLPTIIVIDKAGLVQFTAVGVPDFDQLDAVVTRLMK